MVCRFLYPIDAVADGYELTANFLFLYRAFRLASGEAPCESRPELL